MLFVLGIARERAKLARDFRRRRIRNTRHDRSQRSGQGAAFVTVVTKAHVHQKTADIGIAKTQRTEVERALCDLFGWELRHHHRDFESDGPQACGVHVLFDLKLAILIEGQQVHRRKVTRRIIKEHILGARVRTTDCTVFWASVPRIYGIVELNARISTSPSGMANLCPKIARLDRLGHGTFFAVHEVPVTIFANSFQKRIRDADRVVRVLTRNA
mmetsp:Transcript_12735/g.32616  ORF Transcript_12735/g.32616 Transcript_12735/m.32616 type:complete len:215 (+) Transcript_12735:2-646(+)